MNQRQYIGLMRIMRCVLIADTELQLCTEKLQVKKRQKLK